ncbi:UDP-N-acetylmuramate dehydrogenase [Candidatus Schneideria nysicola]|uniref:UDP-N-acetylmuramate dehydrogenase n=1 Tax=Candidatus Schneideria nysicola TaxID=1081631 RepID=UPI001CAA4A1C|nr:UDP-N-acetylmuramate dehydrogenase [Candidatus Schneideria nysicola]UAJ65493.1 UDP-N-acetylmuramate dehydrogenase [Candidatus Schneideria nysicola]
MNSVAIKSLNTFRMNVFAKRIVVALTEEDLLKAWRQATILDNQPILILGGGSNVLFLENYMGTILLNRIRGITIKESKDAWYLYIHSGEIWNRLVNFSINQNMPGLENLAFIPGYVGTAPIQNIGAYGVEFCQFCEYVDILQLDNGKKYRLNKFECCFDYRESIFKHSYRNNYAIIAVNLRIDKIWKPIIHYNGLTHFNVNRVTPRQILNRIFLLRKRKIPNPLFQGNAGSFFKNPIVDAKTAKILKNKYKNIPIFSVKNNQFRLSAGWLIEKCQLKGYKMGNAEVYNKQALILVNNGKATGTELILLAKYIRDKVSEKFSIWLEPEVRFIASQGEIDPYKIL